jgi:hypothetical protein
VALPAAVKVPGAAGPPLLLAETWADIDPTGWWVGEKHDGVRAYWDGARFLSRLGNVYHFEHLDRPETRQPDLRLGCRDGRRADRICPLPVEVDQSIGLEPGEPHPPQRADQFEVVQTTGPAVEPDQWRVTSRTDLAYGLSRVIDDEDAVVESDVVPGLTPERLGVGLEAGEGVVVWEVGENLGGLGGGVRLWGWR